MEASAHGEHRFRRLAITHALMIAADAAMVVALADSFFFDVDPNGARSKTLAFLLVSFAPFVVLAPFIGPVIDRVRGGRRVVIMTVAAARVIVQVAMVFWVDSPALFPLVFVALVLQKTYTVSKQALVPTAVDDQRQLVEANAKLGVIAGLAGTAAVLPASIAQLVDGSRSTLVLSAALFGAGCWSARRLPTGGVVRSVVPHEPGAPRKPLSIAIRLSWSAMFVLRALAGYMLFYLAFWFRGGGVVGDDGAFYVALALAAGGLATIVGNLIAPRASRFISNEALMGVALAVPTLMGSAALVWAGPGLAIGVTAAVSFGGSLGRLSFESVVQRDIEPTQRGTAFARYETRFQLGWVIAALIPVMLRMPASSGLVVVGAVGAATLLVYGLESNAVRRDRAARVRPTSRARPAR